MFQILDVQVPSETTTGTHEQLCYDPEWLAVLQATHRLTPTGRRYGSLPPFSPPTPAALAAIIDLFAATSTTGTNTSSVGGVPDAMCALPIPLTFERTAPAFEPPYPGAEYQQPRSVPQPTFLPENRQTTQLLAKLQLLAPPVHAASATHSSAASLPHTSIQAPLAAQDPAEIDLD